MRRIVFTLLLACVLGLSAFAFIVWRGLYDVSATGAHTQPVYDLLEVAMHRSAKRQAARIAVPDLLAPEKLARGAACFRDACVQCHGGPGVAPQPFAMSLQPLPGPLVDAAHRFRPAELYWITRHGIKMSGMPAWGFRLNDEDLWSVVAFLQRLPSLSPKGYAAAMTQAANGPACTSELSCRNGQCPPVDSAQPPVPGLNTRAARGPLLLRQYACTACHMVPGVVGSPTHVGPPLERLWQRTLIAGKLPRTEEALASWIRKPQAIDPETAMPDMGVSEAHAKEIAAYLLTPR